MGTRHAGEQACPEGHSLSHVDGELQPPLWPGKVCLWMLNVACVPCLTSWGSSTLPLVLRNKRP
jgi:hypothetical protein